MTNPTPSPLPKSGEPIVSELDDALHNWDINQRPTWVKPIVEAARRVANPDYEAATAVLWGVHEAFDAKVMANRVVNAALGITTKDGEVG